MRMNDFSGQDSGPVNKRIGPYLLLGMVNKQTAIPARTVGFVSNHKSVLYKNCDRAGRNFFAFFGPHNSGSVSSYHKNNLVYEKAGVAVAWRKTAAVVSSVKRMPSNYFLFTEMHFGGCGCYTSSDRWSKAVSPALGTAVGLR